MKVIFLISGLGADKRVFDFIEFGNHKLNHIIWIDPFDGEAIEGYAQRLLKQIHSERPTLIGVSFGGIIAIEMGKLIETEQVILISSAKTKFDIPFYYKIVGQLGLNRITPAVFLKKVNFLTFWLFGAKNRKEKELLRSIINDTDSRFLRWAIDQIANWRNVTQVKNTNHIHGTADRILPLKTADFKIDNGGHFMIVNKADEISRLIEQILD